MRRLKLLDAEQLAIVMDVYERGKVKVSADFDTGVREGLEKMGILDVYWHYMGAGSSWSLKDDYRQTIDKHGKSYFIEQARKGSK